MRVFVVGGAGYVGSFCVRRLIRAGHSVTVYDDLSSGHRRAVDPQACFVQGDLGDRNKLASVFAEGRFDAAMHFAAYLNVGESVSKPLKYWRNNVANTLTLLDCLEAHGVKRFVFSSSCAVYGEPTELPITENTPRHPVNPYGSTKLAVEWIMEQSARAWGLAGVALRYFNAAGAAADGSLGEDHDPELHLIPIVLQVALGQRQHVEVFGTDYPTPDGTCIRDYVHVEDLAEAHLLALEKCVPGRFEAYNVGTGTGSSVLEVISTARVVTGKTIPAVESARRPGDPPVLYADAGAIARRYGWAPRYRTLTEIISSAWAWHCAYPNGYGSG